MKTLHFTTTVGGGGAETMLCNLIEQMKGEGMESVVVSTTSSEGDNSLLPRIEKSAAFYDLDTGSLMSPKLAWRFWEVLQREKPDVVQTWMHTSGLVIGLLCRLAGVKNVVWAVHSRGLLCHHPLPCRKCSWIGRALGIGAKILPKRVISCSQDGLKNHCEELGYPKSKMVWIGNGIDLERFKPRPKIRQEWRKKLGISESDPVIGMMSRLNPVKDVPNFLRAAAKLQKRLTNAHIIMCGEDLSFAGESVKQAAAALPDQSRMHWLGFHPNAAEVYPLYDVLAVSSRSEAFPMVLIEAMACGVPCVSTDVGDAKVIVADAGRIVPVSDSSAMCEAWEQLVSLPKDEFSRLRERARELSVERFGLEDCAKKYREVYEELAAAA